MTAVALIALFAGYAVVSYGYVLVRGYDIRWQQWINPLHPYAWPAGNPKTIAPGQVFP